MKTTGNIVIRPFAVTDIPAVLVIQQASPGAAQWSRLQYERSLADAGSYAGVVAEQGRGIVGFLLYRSTPPHETEVINLAVAPDARRQGVATTLLSALRNEIAGDIFLEVRCANEPAKTLYERCGFSAVGRRKDYYKAPADDALIMKLGGGSRQGPAAAIDI